MKWSRTVHCVRSPPHCGLKDEKRWDHNIRVLAEALSHWARQCRPTNPRVVLHHSEAEDQTLLRPNVQTHLVTEQEMDSVRLAQLIIQTNKRLVSNNPKLEVT